MCGIIHAKNLRDNEQVNDLTKILYENQKSRGKTGFGFVGMNKDSVDTYRALTEKEIIKYLNDKKYDEIMFHHRFPTSTNNTLNATHPFEIKYGNKKYFFIHNGVISNAKELGKKHKKLKLKYNSKQKNGAFNDSEALAYEFILWLNKDQKEIDAIGSVAFICLESDIKTNRAEKLYFYRNDSSPLNLFKDKTIMILSSEGAGDEIKKNHLYFFDYKTKQIKKDKFLDIKYYDDFTFNRYQDNNDYDYPYNYADDYYSEMYEDCTPDELEIELSTLMYEKEDSKKEQKLAIKQKKNMIANNLQFEINDIDERINLIKKLLNSPKPNLFTI